MKSYISDECRLTNCMGQFQVWYGKLFYFKSKTLGWVYLKGVV